MVPLMVWATGRNRISSQAVEALVRDSSWWSLGNRA
jgi:hypothetical protein